MTASSLVGLSSLAVPMVPAPTYDAHGYEATWANLGSSGMGQPLGGGKDNSLGSGGAPFGTYNYPQMPAFNDKSVQFSGNFSSVTLTSASLLGSNDGGLNWFNIKDVNGNAITMSSGGIVNFNGAVEQLMPVAPGGDTNTAINCFIYMRRQFI